MKNRLIRLKLGKTKIRNLSKKENKLKKGQIATKKLKNYKRRKSFLI